MTFLLALGGRGRTSAGHELTAEPYGGWLLAGARERENLRNVEKGKNYLPGTIPCRILAIFGKTGRTGHVALVYRLTPEGWMVYDDTFFSRRLHVLNRPEFPDPLEAALEAFPNWEIGWAEWWE